MGEILRKQPAPAPGAPAPAAQAHGHADDGEYKLPHGSKWPIIAAGGLAILYLGVVALIRVGGAMGWGLFGLGALVILFAIQGVVREDTQWWRDRVATGARNGWWGVVFFLGTEVMLFGALFATFFNHRSFGGPDWELQKHLPVFNTGINTAILLASGVTMHLGHSAIRKGDVAKLKLWLGLTILLGAVFLVGQVNEYRELAAAGMTVQGVVHGSELAETIGYAGPGTFGAAFYILTGTHGAHVLGGLVVLSLLFVRTMRGNFDQQRHVALEAGAIYWHFVDVVWVLLFAIVYLRMF